jgi:hypothetical protein
MTLLSNAFIPTPSTVIETATTIDRGDVWSIRSPSTSSTFIDGPTPSQVLAMTIKKKRKVLRSKDRNLRVELLLTSTIRRLCQEIGDHLRSRRSQNLKRKSSNGFDQDIGSSTPATVSKRSRYVVDENGNTKEEEVGPKQMSESPSANSIGSLAFDDQKISEDHSNDQSQLRPKRKSDPMDEGGNPKRISNGYESSKDNDKDPFGLDEFFRSLRSCPVGGSKRYEQ